MTADDEQRRYAVPLVNERTGERHVVIVELSEDEHQVAVRHAPFELQVQGEGWRPLVNLFLCKRALNGLPDDWAVPYSEITRVVLH
jgi:hypothetical protein